MTTKDLAMSQGLTLLYVRKIKLDLHLLHHPIVENDCKGIGLRVIEKV